MGTSEGLDEETLQELYNWVDTIPLSRPKKNIARDFSDGVLIAEMVKHYFPREVEVHNYVASNSINNKRTNWHTLNRKIFKKLDFELSEEVIKSVVNCKPWVIERILLILRTKIDRRLFEQKRRKSGGDSDRSERPEADQGQFSGGYIPSTSSQSKYGPTSPGFPTKQMDFKMHKHTEMVPKILLEEREQESLAKEETIEILKAKVRRLEHLLHLKDIRIDDLQSRLEQVEQKYRPTAAGNKR